MLGRELALRLDAEGVPYVGSDRDVDVTDPGSLERFCQGKDIDWVINCSGYTAVDRAEDEPDLCFRINTQGPENLAAAATLAGATMIHFSTDYVFGGMGTRPYVEDDPLGPVGVYARSKADSEPRVRSRCPHSFILRTAWLYGASGTSFPLTMLRLLGERDVVRVVNDQTGCPTWAGDLAGAVCALVARHSSEFGTYHYAGEGQATWYEVAEEVRAVALDTGLLTNAHSRVEPVTTDQYPTRATRPAYSVLSKEKFRRTFGLEIPHWRTSLRAFLSEVARHHSRRPN